MAFAARRASVDCRGARPRRRFVTVVFLHAFPLDERMWAGQHAGPLYTIAPRLYGLGQTMDEWAAAVADDVEGELTLVGASMGGYCALALARREPERVRGALLLGGERT